MRACLFIVSSLLLFVLADPGPMAGKLFRVQAEFDIKVPMRDGVLLSTDVYRPDSAGKYPVLLLRTPYNNYDPTTGYFFAEQGYAVVLQDVRGKYDSDGTFYPYVNEGTDGLDTHTWCAAQPWSNGKIGTMGSSYVGATQVFPALLGSEHLACMVPAVAATDIYHHGRYEGGAFALTINTIWGALAATARTAQDVSAQPLVWPDLLNTLPVGDLPAKLGRRSKFYADWLAHPTYDDYWKSYSAAGKQSRIAVPALWVSGWYDIFLQTTIENFTAVRNGSVSESAREAQRLVIGPWTHALREASKVGDIDFGAASVPDMRQMELSWFNLRLKNDMAALDSTPAVRLFVMGENAWRTCNAWPPEGSHTLEFALNSQKGANSLYGDGTLDHDRTHAARGYDSFTYDPANPVPTLGGNNSGLELLWPSGPVDQRPIERRDDVLVYTGAPLSGPLTVIGPVTLRLWASSSAANTDFTAKLIDVYPDGRAINISSGILRAPLREGFETWKELEAGNAYEFVIAMTPTANTFLPGHKIRVHISSSDFPRFDRNLNTPGADISQKTEMKSAQQTVYHDKEHPSRILLSVIGNPGISVRGH